MRRDPCKLQVGELIGDNPNLLAAAIQPNQLQIADHSAAENEQAVVRGRDIHVPGTGIVHHTLGYHAWLPAPTPLGWIERLRHQLVTAGKQKKSGGIDRVGARMHQITIFTAVERREVHRIVPRLGEVMVHGQIQEMLSVGQDKRPAMRCVPCGVNLGDLDRSAPAGVDPQDGRVRGRGKQDISVRTPSSPAPELGVADDDRCATVELDRLQFSVAEKSQRAAVG
jgi:hypothetical protein